MLHENKKTSKADGAEKARNSDIPYSYLHSFHRETLRNCWFALKNRSSLRRSACSRFLCIIIQLLYRAFSPWLCECVGVVSVETHTHTHTRTRRWGVSPLYCTHTLHSLLQKLHIQFKGLFFINLYLSGLSWLSERAVFHYFPCAHIHSGEPRWKKKNKKNTSDLFISSNSSFNSKFSLLKEVWNTQDQLKAASVTSADELQL